MLLYYFFIFKIIIILLLSLHPKKKWCKHQSDATGEKTVGVQSTTNFEHYYSRLIAIPTEINQTPDK
jgi:hypothetical protein